MLPLLEAPKVGTILQKKVTGSFVNRFVLFGGFPIFGSPDLVDDPGELGDDVKKIEDNLDMRNFFLDSLDVGVPHIHDHGFQLLLVALGHLIEKAAQGFGPTVFSNPDHASSFVIQNHCQVPVAPADGNLVYSQNPDSAGIDLSILNFQEALVYLADCLPVQTHMIGHFLDGHHLAEVVDIERQTLRDTLTGSEEIQVFHHDLSAVDADDLAVPAMEPDSTIRQIQISDLSFPLAVNPCRRTSTTVANGKKTSVGLDIDTSRLGDLRDGMMS
jgi:hypothetical protein